MLRPPACLIPGVPTPCPNPAPSPLCAATGTLGNWDVMARVTGGGHTGQSQAVRHGIARALQNWDPALRPALKAAGARAAGAAERTPAGPRLYMRNSQAEAPLQACPLRSVAVLVGAACFLAAAAVPAPVSGLHLQFACCTLRAGGRRSTGLLHAVPSSTLRLGPRAGLLARDMRIVERKKAGLKKARKAFQWVKR